MKQLAIPLKQLIRHPKRDNHCPPEIQEKIQRHIQRTGNYEPLVVYSDAAFPNRYTIINGHVRFEIAQSLGWNKIECYIWDVTPAEAELALATLNTLKGSSDQEKREALLASLAEQFSSEDLACLLPESQAMLDDLIQLQALDTEKQERALQAALEEEIKSLPVMMTFVVSSEGKAIIEKALAQHCELDTGEALVTICQAYGKVEQYA